MNISTINTSTMHHVSHWFDFMILRYFYHYPRSSTFFHQRRWKRKREQRRKIVKGQKKQKTINYTECISREDLIFEVASVWILIGITPFGSNSYYFLVLNNGEVRCSSCRTDDIGLHHWFVINIDHRCSTSDTLNEFTRSVRCSTNTIIKHRST